MVRYWIGRATEGSIAELERTLWMEREPCDRVRPRGERLEVEGCPRAASMSCQRTPKGCCDGFPSESLISAQLMNE